MLLLFQVSDQEKKMSVQSASSFYSCYQSPN